MTLVLPEHAPQLSETTSSSCDNDSNQSMTPKIPVDRQWLQKLLQKHDTSSDNDTSGTMKAHVLAPMVDQSDLPFRLQCRKYGANLCFTPMIHAKMFSTNMKYQKAFTIANNNNNNNTPTTTTTTPAPVQQDRPLIAQICGGNAQHVLQTCLALQDYCDGIDLNCGCPQTIAKRGNYGAFLLEETEQLVSLVRMLVAELNVPLSVKVRLLPGATRDESVQKSLVLYKQLVDAGVHMLTIHGRTRFHKGVGTGAADWDAIQQAVELLGHRIPIMANGSIESREQADECLAVTGADGVMSSEAILEYPAIFLPASEPRISRTALALEYLQLSQEYPPDVGGQGSGLKCVKMHLHRFLHADLQVLTQIRQRVIQAASVQDLLDAVHAIQQIHKEQGHDVATEKLSWYMRHRTIVRTKAGMTVNVGQEQANREATVVKQELDDSAADCFACLFDEEE